MFWMKKTKTVDMTHMTPEERNAAIDGFKTIESVSVTFDREPEAEQKPINDDGFEMPPGYFASILREMKKFDAGRAYMSFPGCRNLGGYDITIGIYAPGYFKGWRKYGRKLAERLGLI